MPISQSEHERETIKDSIPSSKRKNQTVIPINKKGNMPDAGKRVGQLQRRLEITQRISTQIRRELMKGYHQMW